MKVINESRKKITRIVVVCAGGLTVVGLVTSLSCNLLSTSSSSSTAATTTTTSTSRTINANTTTSKSITTSYGGTCLLVTRDASSCKSARQALGLSGNWLNFSCNVVLGLTDSSGTATTTYANASYVTVTFYDLPDYTSNYYPTSSSYSFTANGYTVTGTYTSVYSAYTTTFPDPSSIAQQSVTMSIPITPAYVGTKTMSAGMVGVSVNGIAIYNNLADSTDNIFAEAGSFDQCQGHPSGENGGTYHYHSEPYSISDNDNHLIGVMRDGYFIYGRQDFDGTTPGSTAKLQTAGTSSTLYQYGGHTGADPITGSGTTFHYHLTEWQGCYHESSGTKSTDDGETYDTINTTTGSCSGTWVDTWFMTGHGNGGVYMSVPSGLAGQSPSQSTAGIRYYYGTAGSCTGC